MAHGAEFLPPHRRREGVMVDRPILFSGSMIRAILREIKAPGTGKTMTRRIIKPRPWNREGDTVDISVARSATITTGADERRYVQFEHPRGGPLTAYLAPYDAGDRLWVRETWAVAGVYDGWPPRRINPTGKPGWCGIRYAATDERLGIKDRPSVHMPRWASRLTLHVTDVRVERLRDISEGDARAEGISPLATGRYHCGYDEEGEITSKSPVTAFGWLWNSINGPDAWMANPWVAAISFRPVLANIDAGDA